MRKYGIFQIDRELAELSEPDFDDDSDESVHDPLPQHHQGKAVKGLGTIY